MGRAKAGVRLGPGSEPGLGSLGSDLPWDSIVGTEAWWMGLVVAWAWRRLGVATG